MQMCFTILKLAQRQSRIKLGLDNKKIKYEIVDLCKDSAKRDEMRSLAGIPDLLPPQLFNGDTYCGVSNSI